MYDRYRKLKHFCVPALLALGLWLMRGEPEETSRWIAGIWLSASLVAAYVAEELWWMAKRTGRPCPKCGRKLELKAFQLASRCPSCGESP
jgi:hypothetical protein